jgi:hypothetical protein
MIKNFMTNENDEIFTEEELEFPHKSQRRSIRNKKDFSKAKRKSKLVHYIYPDGWNAPSLNYFKKNKIHCSCPMCSAKTNDNHNRSNGPVDGFRGTRMTGTHHRYGKKNYKPSDQKRIDKLVSIEKEFYNTPAVLVEI